MRGLWFGMPLVDEAYERVATLRARHGRKAATEQAEA
jgi:hypothetical protein